MSFFLRFRFRFFSLVRSLCLFSLSLSLSFSLTHLSSFFSSCFFFSRTFFRERHSVKKKEETLSFSLNLSLLFKRAEPAEEIKKEKCRPPWLPAASPRPEPPSSLAAAPTLPAPMRPAASRAWPPLPWSPRRLVPTSSLRESIRHFGFVCLDMRAQEEERIV